MTDQRPALIRQDIADPFDTLRQQEKLKSGGKPIERDQVAKTLIKLHRFADHLKRKGENTHPLIRQPKVR